MAETLCSVGLDVGTTSTQMIVSELRIENRASSFAVPELEISGRRIVYESPVHFTPLLDEAHVDGQKIRALVAAEYAAAGIAPGDVDTGAVIITGETARKENARAVLHALSDYAGNFVVATAGPDLESVLAARGAGAADWSAQTGQRVIHVDIGGGTSNFCWLDAGAVASTGCLNVGGRLVKFDKSHTVTYVSPVLEGLCKLKPGDTISKAAAESVAELLTQALETAVGLGDRGDLLQRLMTAECAQHQFPHWPGAALSFSGGVADCVGTEMDWDRFGDIGPVLGQTIRRSPLCAGVYRLGEQAIRATVIGAGCHSTQLSGSTVFYQNVPLPLKNMPVAVLEGDDQPDARRVEQALSRCDADWIALALPGLRSPGYEQISAMADALARGFGVRPAVVALEQDMAKALGHALALRLGRQARILCIDNVRFSGDSYLDVGAPMGPALPVVVKTLILSK